MLSSLRTKYVARSYSTLSKAVHTHKPLSKKLYDPTPVLGSGFVRLIDHMPYKINAPLFCDAAITQMARISYSDGTKKISSDEGLIRYLMRNHHTSPFEAVEFKFHLKIPIFVERQLIRHRTASVNQVSGRYSILPEDYYIPTHVRKQSSGNKQGSQGVLDEKDPVARSVAYIFQEKCLNVNRHNYYNSLVNEHNVAREMARIVLSQNLFTELYWKIDLHNLFHFLHLRQSEHAQQEIRDVADAIYNVVKELCPVSTQAFLDYRVNAMVLSAEEVKAIQTGDFKDISTKREREALTLKMRKLGC